MTAASSFMSTLPAPLAVLSVAVPVPPG
jgi:hypothetical protein